MGALLFIKRYYWCVDVNPTECASLSMSCLVPCICSASDDKMSRYTTNRLPSNILHLFNVYERASNALQPLEKVVGLRDLINRNSPFHHNFSRQKLVHNTAGKLQMDSNDYPPLISHVLQPMFSGQINLPNLENRSTDEIFKDFDNLDETIDSTYTSTAKRYTDFQARILQSLSSYYDPMQKVPHVKAAENTYRWCLRLLENTPIVIVLKQKNRLFSHSTLHQINKPFSDLRAQIDLLKANVAATDDLTHSRFKTYHLFDITTTDILSLAVKNSNPQFTGNDEFCNFLAAAQNPAIVNPKAHDLNSMQKRYPIKDLYQEFLDGRDVSEVFPFDLTFNDLYGITIEASMLPHFDRSLIDILEKFKDEYEVSLARFSLGFPEVAKFFEAEVAANEVDSNYDDLLQAAQTTKQPKSNVAALAEYMGQSGLTRVEQGHNCVYLVKP